MKFRLVYEGPLPSNGDRDVKQSIRRQLHPQLIELWNQPPLCEAHEIQCEIRCEQDSTSTDYTPYQHRGPFRFLPLIARWLDLTCALDILFLRREAPGSLVSGGDIDNRIKTLFDALRVPEENELPKQDDPIVNEDPFYCLLEDDSLITRVNIETDRLLTANSSSANSSNVFLIIQVCSVPIRVSGLNLLIAGT